MTCGMNGALRRNLTRVPRPAAGGSKSTRVKKVVEKAVVARVEVERAEVVRQPSATLGSPQRGQVPNLRLEHPYLPPPSTC